MHTRKIPLLAITLLAALLLLASTAFALTREDIYAASRLHHIQESKKLVVGMEIGYYPFEYVGKDGGYTGFDVGLAELMAKYLGVELVIKDTEWKNLITDLQEGRLDCIISAMSLTMDRELKVSFSAPYFETGLALLLSKEKAPGVTNPADLDQPGRTIAVIKRTTGDLEATRLFPKAKVLRLENEKECVKHVISGQADAFMFDQISVWKLQRQYPKQTEAILEPLTHEFFAVAVAKGDPDFLNWINNFFRVIRGNGLFETLYQKNLGGLPAFMVKQ